MCEPVSIVTGIMAAVGAITSTAVSIDQENKAIEAQNQELICKRLAQQKQKVKQRVTPAI